jgi:hypothetical protein
VDEDGSADGPGLDKVKVTLVKDVESDERTRSSPSLKRERGRTGCAARTGRKGSSFAVIAI